MKIAVLFTDGFLLILALAGCTGEDQRPLGQPTALLAGEFSLDAMCRMRSEFGALQAPVSQIGFSRRDPYAETGGVSSPSAMRLPRRC